MSWACLWVTIAISIPLLGLALGIILIARFVHPNPANVEIEKVIFPAVWSAPTLVEDRWYSALETNFDLCTATTFTSATISWRKLDRKFFAHQTKYSGITITTRSLPSITKGGQKTELYAATPTQKPLHRSLSTYWTETTRRMIIETSSPIPMMTTEASVASHILTVPTATHSNPSQHDHSEEVFKIVAGVVAATFVVGLIILSYWCTRGVSERVWKRATTGNTYNGGLPRRHRVPKLTQPARALLIVRAPPNSEDVELSNMAVNRARPGRNALGGGEDAQLPPYSRHSAV